MYRVHPRDKRRWFQIHCCNTVVTANPIGSSLGNVAFGLGMVMVAIIGVLMIGAISHYALAAGTVGVLHANVPVVTKELEGKIESIVALIKQKSEDDEKKYDSLRSETVEEIKKLQTQMDAIDKKMAERHAATTAEHKSLEDALKENESVARLIKDKKGRALITLTGNHAAQVSERKAILDSGLGTITPGVLDADRMPGIVLEARRKLTVRNVLSARPTALPLVYWVKVNSPLSVASPQTEGSSKYENAVTFTTANSPVKTIATFVKASRQALTDFGELASFLNTGLAYYVNREEETQLLSGDNTGENLNGLVTQSTGFNTALLPPSAGWTRIDQIGAAIEQIGIADEVDPSFVILNKKDWWDIRRTKDSFGRYILGDPQSAGNPKLWDLDPVPTNSIPQGTFLVGSGDPAAAEIRDRMEMEIAISYEDSDNFEKNLVTVRAEKRVVLCVLRPASYIHGTFTTSPA